MQIDGGLFEITMAEQDLNRAQVSACLQQVGRETVSKGMRVNMAICKSGAFGGALAGRPQDLGCDRSIPCVPGVSATGQAYDETVFIPTKCDFASKPRHLDTT